jgi:hypothetical protein
MTDAATMDRTISPKGRFNAFNTRILVGRSYTGQTIHVIYTSERFEVFDQQGTSIGSAPRPSPNPNSRRTISLQPDPGIACG